MLLGLVVVVLIAFGRIAASVLIVVAMTALIAVAPSLRRPRQPKPV